MRNRTVGCAGAAIAALAVSLSVPSADGAVGCPAPAAVAHRGAAALAPEETGPAIMTAVKGGAKVIDADIRFTKSNVPVLLHDATVDRTTNGTGNVSALWLWQLKALDAGSWFSPAYKNTRIITLDEALRLIAPYSGRLLSFEVKGIPTTYQLQRVRDTVANRGMNGRVVVGSFDAASLARFHSLAPTVALALGTTGDPAAGPAAAIKAHARYWAPISTTLTADSVTAAHAASLVVWPWTLNTAVEWERMATLGADGITTDKAVTYLGWVMAKCGVAP